MKKHSKAGPARQSDLDGHAAQVAVGGTRATANEAGGDKSPETRKPGRGPKPEWLKTRLPGAGQYAKVRRLLQGLHLNTVCVEARCPNLGECWGRGAVTVMILGENCSRRCRFCSVGHGKLVAPDPEEPEAVASALAELGLSYAVLTSVTRDDLSDGGAAHWAAVIQAVRRAAPEIVIEVLVPDFGADEAALELVWKARPDIFGHNLETVARLSPAIRPQADYRRSLKVLEASAQAGMVTKSGLMVGLGETKEEVGDAMADLRAVGVQIVTLGQYLQPTRKQIPVARYVTPEEFDWYRREGLAMGFSHVESGPLVRSSYRADQGARAAGVLPGPEGSKVEKSSPVS